MNPTDPTFDQNVVHTQPQAIALPSEEKQACGKEVNDENKQVVSEYEDIVSEEDSELGVWCTHHRVSTHSTQNCRFRPVQSDLNVGRKVADHNPLLMKSLESGIEYLMKRQNELERSFDILTQAANTPKQKPLVR